MSQPINNRVKNLFYRMFCIQGYAFNSRSKDGNSGGGGSEKTLKAIIRRATQDAKYGNIVTIHYHLRDGTVVTPPIMTIGAE